MTESEHTEYMNLINLWNCSEPMTRAQLERMHALEECVFELPKGEASAKEGRKYNAGDERRGDENLNQNH